LAGVGVHDHDRPVAALDLPGQRRVVRCRDLRGPEGLIRGRGRRGVSFDARVEDAIRVEVDVADLVAADALEVAGDVVRGTDSGEARGAAGGRSDIELDSAERASVDEPVGRSGLTAEVEVVRRHRVRRRRHAEVTGMEEPVLAVGRVADDRADASY